MSSTTVSAAPVAAPAAGAKAPPKLFGIDSRFVAPIFITFILLVGQLTYGILESYAMTALAIVTAVALEGTESNRSAVGAQVRVYWAGQEQVQEVSGGNGFCAQNQRRLHFGLGKGARVERVEIRWPSGKVQTIDAPEVGKVHRVREA